ncbi:MAG: hypothetical protein LPK45_00045 [Bacteroidota bacterium]|nr:hypothetical protein [Bacteroidota bacterium]MDX5429411.1 hypothetical protein [Bacteroidota bacterium]MDX5468202.1 hypothetical protein [Bacteroidota bacterium]
MVLRIALHLVVLAIVLTYYAMNRFQNGRLILLLGLIPAHFISHNLTGVPIQYPYIVLNTLVVYELEYLMLSFLIVGPGDRYRLLYIGFFMLLFIGDILLIPIFMDDLLMVAWHIASRWDFIIFKTSFTAIICLQLFSLNYVRRLIQGLLSANRELESAIEGKLQSIRDEFTSGKE